jgi:hypothetical protein
MVNLYLLSGSLLAPGPAGAPAGDPRFVMRWGAGSPPNTIALADAGGHGTFAFLSAKTAAAARSQGPAGWAGIANRIHALTPAQCCWLGEAPGVPAIQTDPQGVLTNNPMFHITPHLAIALAAGTRFSIDPGGTGLIVDNNGVAQGLALNPRQIGDDNFGQSIPLSGRLLLFVGQNGADDGTGEFRFSAGATDAILADLNLDLRYFKAATQFPGQVLTAALKFPVFALGGASAILTAGLDPLGDPTMPASLGWLRIGHADGQSPLPTNFLTVHGHNVHLLPHPNDAKAVFSPTVEAIDPTNGAPTDQALSLTPTGPHEMWVPTDTGTADHYLLAGNRGTELLPFTARNGGTPGDSIEFAASKPAFYNASLAAVGGTPAPQAVGLTLTDLGKTAWIAVKRTHNAGGMDYIIQSQDAPLRAPKSQSVLQFADLANQLAWSIPAATSDPHVPTAPLSAVAGDSTQYLDAIDLETNALAPHRRTVMQANRGARPALAAVPATTTTTTPQGFLADVTADGQWQRVTIALSESTTSPKLILQRPDSTTGSWVIQEALQQRAVFLVVTGVSAAPQALGTADLSIRICDWEFSFELPGWPAAHPSGIAPGTDAPILIIKFSDRPISAVGPANAAQPPLIADPKSWTMPDVFSGDVGGQSAQAALKGRINNIISASQGSDAKALAFGYFINTRLTNPNWNGVMMLGATMASPPDEIAAIKVGFPTDFRLQAICLGIDANKIAVAPPQHAGDGAAPAPPLPAISLVNSAIFALVSYPSGGGAVDTPPGWDASNFGIAFQVTQLLLQIENSAVASFACDARLRLPSFLGGIAAADENDVGLALIELHGKYEKRAGGASNVFLLSGDVSSGGGPLPPITFKDLGGGIVPALRQLTVSRIQLSCTLVVSNPKQFACTFAMSGTLDFEPFPPGFPAISITGLTFDNATVTLTFRFKPDGDVDGNPVFDVDVGKIRLTIDSNTDLGTGLLKELPFRLSALHFSGFHPPRPINPAAPSMLSVGSLGMVEFGFGGLRGLLDSFDFGLEFSLDLGGFGGLVSAARKLSASIVIGWPDFRRPALPHLPLSLGFRIDGGGGALDLGVEGILKITAKSVDVKNLQGGIAVVLNKCQLDVLGLEIPDPTSELDFFIFLPSNAPDRPAWYGCFSGDSILGPIDLKLLSVAQRLKLFADGMPYATDDAVKRIKAIGAIQDPADLLGKQVTYAPDLGWSFGLSGDFTGVVGLEAVLADPIPVYGLRVSIPPDGSLFTIDALYTRIADDIGVFSAEIAPPDTFRQIFLGPVEIDIGNLGLQVFSNGSWTFDLGFPRGLDFARSFVAQIGPFIGFGGTYIASRDARTTTLLAGKNCSKVLEMGLAVRVGLGRQIERGPFSAGASISVFGIFEGAFGVGPAGTTFVHLIGQVGAIAEVYGYVNFAIVRAAVSIRVYAEITVDVETGGPIILAIDAGVSVRVSVVIGHIHFWHVDIEIRISFSFDTHIHFGWTITRDSSAALAELGFATAPTPLQWTPETVFTAARPLQLTLALDASARFLGVGQAEPVMVVLLSATDSTINGAVVPALADLLEALLRWVLTISGLMQRGVPDTGISVSSDAIESICQALNPPGTDSLNRLGPQPLAMPVIAPFLKQNFTITIDIPGAASGAGDSPRTTNSGVLVPIIPDLAVSFLLPSGATSTVDFGDISGPGATVCDGTYEEKLNEWFARQSALLDVSSEDPVFAAAEDKRTAATIMFEDWLAHLVKQVFACARQVPAQSSSAQPSQATLADLVAAVRKETQHITGLAARILTYGLRAPTSTNQNAPTKALYELTQQQQPAIPPNIGTAASYTIAVAAARGADWFVVKEPARGATVDVALARELAGFASSLPVPHIAPTQEPSLELRPAVSTATEPITAAIAGKPGTVWTLPSSLLARFAQRSGAPIRVNLTVASAGGTSDTRGTAIPGTLQWATKIDFGLRQVFASDEQGGRSPVQGVYQVVGANKANREAIDLLRAQPLAGKTASLLVTRGGKPTIEILGAGDAVLIKTNFSTDPMPPTPQLAAFAAAPSAQPPASADIVADLSTFLGLLSECSIVNGTGFWLRYWPAAGNLDDLFKPATRDTPLPSGSPSASAPPSNPAPTSVAISLVVQHADLPIDTLRQEVNALISGAMPANANALRIEQPDIPIVHTAVKPGNVMLRLQRPNPDPDPTNSRGPVAALSARYSLLAYSAPAVPNLFYSLDSESCVPIAPNRDDPTATSAPASTSTPQNESDAPVWFYRVVVPFWRLAVANYAQTPNGLTLLPDLQQDPYIGVGQTALTVTLSWRDLYGNSQIGADCLVNNLRIDYCDHLKGLAEWPRMSVGWAPGAAAGTAMVTFTFAGCTKDGDSAGPGLGRYYSQVFNQLKQPDVTVTLTAGSANSSDVKTQLVQFVSGIQVDSTGKVQPASTNITISANFASTAVAVPILAAVTLSIARNKALVASIAGSSAADVDPRLYKVDAIIAPDLTPFMTSAKDPGNIIAWVGFATAFERTYPTLRFLKALDTSSSPSNAASATSPNGTVFCAPAALLAPAPRAAASALTFAPRPLSRALLSGTVQLPFGDLAPGAPIPANGPVVNVADVDVDALAARYLSAIEQALSPGAAVNLRRADSNAFEAIAAAKSSIAKSLSMLLQEVVDGVDGSSFVEKARVAFQNRVRADLSAAYRIGAVVAYACDPYGNDWDKYPRLLGTPSITGTSGAMTPGVKILPAKLDRSPLSATSNPALTFIIEWNPIAAGQDPADTEVPAAAGSLTFAADFVELPDKPDQSGDEYIPSDWFQPLTTVTASRFGQVDIPLPLRRYPTRPKLVLQSAADPVTFAKQRNDPIPTPTSVADRARYARVWHYAMDLTHDLAAGRDQLFLEAHYATVDQPALAALPPRMPFDALVSFDALWTTLGPRLTQLSALSPGDPNVTGFAADARQLAWLCTDLAAALERSLTATTAALAAAPPQIDTGTVRQSTDGTIVAHLSTTSPIAHELIAYVPGFDSWGDFNPPQPGNSPQTTVSVKPPAGAKMSGIRSMRMILSHLDVLAQQTATSSFYVMRNATLGESTIAKAFVYQTDQTSFPNAFVPKLYEADRLALTDSSNPEGRPLAAYLNGLLTPLLTGATTQLSISIAASLATPLGPSATTTSPFGPEWAIYPLPAVPSTPVSDLGSAIAAGLSGEIAAALTLRKSAIRPNLAKPEVRFQITVFGEQGAAQIPLLTLPDVFIPVDAFTIP